MVLLIFQIFPVLSLFTGPLAQSVEQKAFNLCVVSSILTRPTNLHQTVPLSALVAQLDRVLGFEPRCRGFESLRAHHIHKDLKLFHFQNLFDAATLDKHYYDKITASVGPVLSEINKSNASNLFSFQHSDCEIELMSAIKQKQVIYIGLDSLTNPNVAQAVGKALLSDLVSTAGKLYKESHANYRLNLHCDELSEIIQDSFVKILNKAGGAGFQITAYAQTKQDLEVALGSKARAEVTEGNLNTLIMMRVKNEETANLLVKNLPQVGVIGHTQVSMVNDTPHGEEGIYFNTTNEDRVQTTNAPMIEVSDIMTLPKGQAFILVNGGELYKVRIPLPLNDGLAPADIKSVIYQINHTASVDKKT